jgi:YVTN family beta-propeller protein
LVLAAVAALGMLLACHAGGVAGGVASAGGATAAPAAAPPGAGVRPERGAQSLLLVVLKGDDSLAIYDARELRLLGKVACGQVPHQVISDGHLAYVSNYGNGDNTLSVINLLTREVERKVDVLPLLQPHGLALAGGFLWFTTEQSRTVGRFNLKTGKVDWSMGIGRSKTHMILVDRAARLLFTADIGSGGITALDLDQHGMMHIPTGKGAEGIAFTPDQREIWITNREDSTVTILDVRHLQVTDTLKAGGFPVRVAFTPDGQRALVSNAYGNSVSVFDVVSRKEIRRIPVGNVPIDVLVSPDGARAFVACARADQVQVVDLRSYAVVGRLAAGREPEGLAWAEVVP